LKSFLTNFFRDVHYIERSGSEQYHTTDHTPPALEKKMKLLMYFRRYMNDHLIKAGADILAKDADQLSRTPYMYQWYRSTSSVIMQLTNGTLQVCNIFNILYILYKISFLLS